jgi:basic amino acid/polyamine antiporter, APA family
MTAPVAPVHASADLAAASPPRRLTQWTGAAAVVGVVIGSGIFRVPTGVAQLAPEPLAILALWLFGGLLALCLAMLLAEAGTMFPRAGGMYVYLREAWGEGAAFVYGFTFLLVNPASWATLATASAEYLGYFLQLDDPQRRGLAMALILALSLVNALSARLGALLQNLTTSAKVLALVAVIALVGANTGSHVGGFGVAPPTLPPLAGMLLALVAVLWAYDGSSAFCALAGEVRDPQRAIPRALLGGLGLVTLIYVAMNAVLLLALPVERIAATPLALTEAVGDSLGSAAPALIAALVAIATLGSLAGCVLADPRVFFAMGRDRNFVARAGRLHPATLTPVNAIALHALIACLYVSVRSFEQLAATFVLGLVPFYALAAAGVWRLRRLRPDQPRPFRAPWVPALALLWIVVAALLVGNALLETPRIALVNVVITALGVPAWFAWRRFRPAENSR